jgi:hypothetical protein
MLKHVALMCTASWALWAWPAQSQDIPTTDFKEAQRPLDVRERLSAYFQPIGGRIGSFYLYPELAAAANLADNILAREDDGESDAWLEASAGVRLVRPDPVRRLQAQARIDQSVHARKQHEDRTSLLASISYRDGPVDASNLQASASAARRFVERRDVNDVQEARAPIRFDFLSGDLGYTHRLNRLSAEGALSVRRLDYHDARSRSGEAIDQDRRDFTRVTIRVQGGYELSPPVMLLVRGSFSRYDYDLGARSAGFDPSRDSDRDSDLWRLEGGAGIALTDRLHGSATIGYSRRTFVSQPNPPKNSGGLSFSSELLWLPNPATSLRIEARSDFIESASPVIAGFRTAELELTAQRSLSRALLLVGDAKLRRLNPIGGGESRTEYDVAGELTYFLTRRYRLFGSAGIAGRTGGFSATYLRAGVLATF